MSIYEYENYRAFLQARILAQPLEGRGTLAAWARSLGVHPTLISQILNGKKELSLENADQLANLLGLGGAETEYFFTLVQLSRAGTPSLQNKMKSKIEILRKNSNPVAERLQIKNEMDTETAAQFYSSWISSAVRNLIAAETVRDPELISRKLGISRDQAQETLNFLINTGLCRSREGKYTVIPRRTHVAADSPFVKSHHSNWRMKAIDKMSEKNSENLFFTIPFSADKSDATKIRQLLLELIEKVHKVVERTEPNTVRCLNIDFFNFTQQ